MRTCIGICILTAAFFNIPTTHAKIALNWATIVSISVVEDEKKGILLGSIVFERGSLGDKKSDRVIAKITNQTFLIGDRNRQVLKFSDLKPGMAIEIVVAGSRGIGTATALGGAAGVGFRAVAALCGVGIGTAPGGARPESAPAQHRRQRRAARGRGRLRAR